MAYLLKAATRTFCSILSTPRALKIFQSSGKEFNAGFTTLHHQAFINELREMDLKQLTPKEIDTKDSYGQSAIWIACHENNLEAYTLLKKYKACLKQHDKQNRTLLHASAYGKIPVIRNKIIQDLLQNGVDPKAQDVLGNDMFKYIDTKDIADIYIIPNDEYQRKI